MTGRGLKMRRSLLIFLATMSLVVGLTAVSWADTIALTFTGGIVYDFVNTALRNTIGWEFSLSAPVTVTQLGFYDADAVGLAADHNVAIWDAGQNQMVSAVVTNADPLDQGFRWVSVAPVTLAAGTYRTGALVNLDDAYYSDTATQTTASPVSYVGGVYRTGDFGYPGIIGYTNNGRFGPNFQFNPVPLPGAVWLLGSGLLGLAGLRRFKKS
jgi:hypothetical protein